MIKRYQVFVSSTYTDLLEERSEVMQALLELDCMPAGMELFPAANEEQWNWIKRIIDESDYYMVIVGGRYGTVSEATGMSYTEMEYRYAAESGKPVIAFLHEKPSKIEAGKTEQSPTSKKKLEQFRKLVEQKLCKYWNSPADLGAKASRSITQLINRMPAVGWVKADLIDENASAEILKLKKHIELLERKLEIAGEEPVGVEDLCSGGDKFEIEFSFITKKPKKGANQNVYYVKNGEHDHKYVTTWDKIFSDLAPEMINPCSEFKVLRRLNGFINDGTARYFEKTYTQMKIEDVRVYSDSFDVIKIQLRALRLITIDEKDNWCLTPYGDSYMNKLLAVHKGQPAATADKTAAP